MFEWSLNKKKIVILFRKMNYTEISAFSFYFSYLCLCQKIVCSSLKEIHFPSFFSKRNKRKDPKVKRTILS